MLMMCLPLHLREARVMSSFHSLLGHKNRIVFRISVRHLNLNLHSTLNRALMSKKLCDVIQCDRTSIWVQWLYQDRLRERSIWTIREHGGSWGWRKILRLRPFLRTIVDYQIGNGDRFFVWQDPWHHLGPLIERFPQGPRHLRLEESAKLSLVISAGEWH